MGELFGCHDHWLASRFSKALSAFLGAPARLKKLRTRDEVKRDALTAYAEDRGQGLQAEPAAMTGAVPQALPPVAPGRVYTIESTPETVVLGMFDPRRPPILTVDSGDVVVYVKTWTHYLNRLQPGITIADLMRLRSETPGRGVHSIIGPVAVRDALPGDMIEVRFLNLRTIDFGVNFHLPAHAGKGVLPSDFPEGTIRFFDLHASPGYVHFNDAIKLRLRPFQGTFGSAPIGDDAVSSVAPDRWAGNIDVKELTVGSSLFVPVFHPGALLFTGDSHALQGDGEVNVTAIETAMEEVRVQFILHQRAPWEWPMIETPTHWIAMGLDPNLNRAMETCLRNTIAFLHLRAGLAVDEAYSLASIAVDFRVSQMVDVNNGIHAMIPKEIFDDGFRQTILIAG